MKEEKKKKNSKGRGVFFIRKKIIAPKIECRGPGDRESLFLEGGRSTTDPKREGV